MSKDFQLSDQMWTALRDCYISWQEGNWRACEPGNNKLVSQRELLALRLMYHGWRKRGIKRTTGVHDVTLSRVREHLKAFLAAFPEFMHPHCACGALLFHQTLCPVWDTYHAGAIAKGHETQARIVQQRHADVFFESPPSIQYEPLCACGCGQKVGKRESGQWNRFIQGHHMAMKKRERLAADPAYRSQGDRQRFIAKVRRSIMDFLKQNPTAERTDIFRHFAHLEIPNSSLSKILRSAIEDRSYGLNDGRFRMPALIPENQKSSSDIFFQTANAVNTMKQTLSNITEQAKTFASLIQQGIDAWTEAGKLLLQMIEADPNAKEVILEQNPDITPEILSRFEAVGRHQIHPKTLLNGSPGMRRLRSLPYSDQERYLTQPVEMVVKKDNGNVEILKVAVKNLTAAQAYQVFTPSGVRDLGGQRAWLESRPSRKHVTGSPYVIKGNKIKFNAGCELSAKELANLLAQMS